MSFFVVVSTMKSKKYWKKIERNELKNHVLILTRKKNVVKLRSTLQLQQQEKEILLLLKLHTKKKRSLQQHFDGISISISI